MSRLIPPGRTIAGLMLALPSVAINASAQSARAAASVSVRVYVSLADSVTRFFPVVGHRLIFYRSARDSAVAVTDSLGSLTIALAPGNYRLVSAAPVAWRGSDYSWNVPITVRAGMPVIDLRAPDGVTAPSNPSARYTGEPKQSGAPQSAATPQTTGDSSAYTRMMIPPKDVGVATLLSFVITGAGQIYAGETGKGVGLMLMSAVGAGLTISAAQKKAECDSGLYDCSGGNADAAVAAGIVAWLTPWVYSMMDAGPAVHRYNAAHGYPAVSLSPTVTRQGRGTAFGLAVSLRP